MKPVHFKARKLGDPLIKDAISAISDLKERTSLKGRIFGGIAVQSYIPESLHRETIDLDFTLLWSGGTTEFRNISQPLVEFLKSKGYEVRFSKKDKTYDFGFNREGEANNSFMIQHPRFSPAYFERSFRRSLEREIANKRTLSYEGLCYSVASPEDLIVAKVCRALTFMGWYNLALPKDLNLEGLGESSKKLRRSVVERFPEVDPKEIAELRLFNDLYDVKSLAAYVGLNNGYFKEVLSDWKRDSNGQNDVYRLMENLEVGCEV